MALASNSIGRPRAPIRALIVTGVALALLGGLVTVRSAAARPQTPPPRGAAARPAMPTGTAEPFTVEYYYRIRWGHQAEFLRLFRKNHLPVLEKEVQMGRMTGFSAVEPIYHAGEETRWDYRVTIVYPSAAAAHSPDPMDDPAFRRALFPDTATFAAEERRRFELLDAHWDVPVVPLKLR